MERNEEGGETELCKWREAILSWTARGDNVTIYYGQTGHTVKHCFPNSQSPEDLSSEFPEVCDGSEI
ncbi:hypothetical protein X798_03951 [Onchocerca flexuosa]|uniref:Uncharacterized protein n=2 Tax=Onchocerca flexuosa TaxID=387005 RepID=A0A183H8D9_9BILA|nr:hypothetical protein X798_03951 [Onchocerca flexuosa]VDO37641.1 unnamed protein product [Onchocerca flexuosa]